MSYTPYTPDNEIWKDQFTKQGRKPKKFYTILKPKSDGNDDKPTIQMIAPTQQTVEQAKLQILHQTVKSPPQKRIRRVKPKKRSQSIKRASGKVVKRVTKKKK